MQKLRKFGASMVVISSVQFADTTDTLTLYAGDSSGEMFKIDVPRLQGQFTGTGDMFAAALLAYGSHSDGPFRLQHGCEMALSVVHHVLARTLASQVGVQADDALAAVRAGELRIVESRDFIMHPVKKFHAVTVSK